MYFVKFIVFETAKVKKLFSNIVNLQFKLNNLLNKNNILSMCFKTNAIFLEKYKNNLYNYIFSIQNKNFNTVLNEFKEILKIAKTTEKTVYYRFLKLI